ncbi:SLC13 family permease [Indioceanicola profundi]|uniref:SLC13 family permease n=1 Tax=Indioceanicola profundi TaxID=2220096 RepID=UPI001CED54CE|nr:SLC13 family permease [Indioceanicola profundi]
MASPPPMGRRVTECRLQVAVTADQTIVFIILGGTLGLFIWNRWRFDVVALVALLSSVVLGVVPADEAFAGFSDPAVVTVAAVLVLSAAIRSSGFLDMALKPLLPRLTHPDVQVFVLAGMVALLSGFMNNVGALAVFLPVALRVAQRTGRSPAALLMPLSFASLLGGLITLIGTPPNLLISGVRRDMLGEGFGIFDFAPVGIGVTLAGLVIITFGWRLIPTDRRGRGAPEDTFRIEDYTTEVRVPPTSPFVGRTVADLEEEGEGDLTVSTIIRDRMREYVPHGHWIILSDDILLLEGDPSVVKRVADAAELALVGGEEIAADPSGGGYGVMEAVVTDSSPIIGSSPAQLQLRRRHGVNLLAIGRRDRTEISRLNRSKISAGDKLVLQGRLEGMPETLSTLGLLPLAERNLRLGQPRHLWLPAAVTGAAVIVATTGLLPVSVTFLAAVVALVVSGTLPLKEAYGAVEWPVLILLAALIPVSEALQTTGGTELLAGALAEGMRALPPVGALALILGATMLVTPVLNNAATVLVMAPIGVGLAGQLGLNPDPFLMAVAVGASCDFLTPIGHQSNTLVMSPAGYRFGDYWRLGLPVSLTVLAVAVPLIAWTWPLS